MKYGFYLPTRGPSATPEALVTLVQRAEAAGFTSVMIADHVVFPVEINSKYPYTVDGAFPGQGDALEQLTLMSFIAASTEKLRLVTSVMVVPQRHPVLTAKMLATVDFLSRGRVTVGVGVGWLREEFEALDAPDFDRRGAVTNECLEIFKTLWTNEAAAFDGEFYSFDELRCQPLPVQKPHPPIWIGGHSRAALKRAARYGDGWHPVGANAAVPLPPDELSRLKGDLNQLLAAEGRAPDSLTLSFKAPVYDKGMTMPDGRRQPFSGGASAIVDDIHAYAGVGVEELIFDFRSPTLEESLERMDRFVQEIKGPAGA